MKRYVVIGLFSLFILYFVPLALVYVFQRNFMYFPPKFYLAPPEVGLEVAQEIRRDVDRDLSVTGLWLVPASDSSPVIIFFHGNGSAVFSNHDIYRDLHSQGLGVYAMGYAGYPGSTGKPNQPDILAGVLSQYDWLIEQGISPDRIVFYGTSLGSGIASQLALKRRPVQLILEAPFNSTLDMGRLSMPVFPVRFLMKDQYRSDKAIQHFDMPLLWLHGTQDEVIPLSQGQKLYDAYTGPKKELVINGGRHTNLWTMGGREFILAEISRQFSGEFPSR